MRTFTTITASIRMHMLIVVASMLLLGCAQILGIEDLPEIAADGGASPELRVFELNGVAMGLLKPLSLQLTHDGGNEILSVASDGEFTFSTKLADGKPYSVSFVSEQSCIIDNSSGVVSGSDIELFLACDGVPYLKEITLSSLTAPKLQISPGRFDYTVEVSVLQETISIAPHALDESAAISVANEPLGSGTPSTPFRLDMGDNMITVLVTQLSGSELAYHINIRRISVPDQHVYGKASNTGEGDNFGESIAISEDTLVIGAPGESSGGSLQNSNSAPAAGAVYVFRRSGMQWMQEAYIKASSPDPGDTFGTSVALLNDILVVGAPGEASAAQGVNADQNDDSAPASGAVYVFRRTGTQWVQEAYIKASNAEANDAFGTSIAFTGDTLAVGAPGEASAATGVNSDQTSNGAVSSGAVYVFRLSGAQWAQETYIKASNPNANDYFGYSIAITGDVLAVGAPLESSDARGINGDETSNAFRESGAAYVFRRIGSQWAQESYVKASNTGRNDYFGFSVALADETLAVGAIYENSAATGIDGDQSDISLFGSGAVYVFRYSGEQWFQEAYIKPSNVDDNEHFGDSVALSGSNLAVGAPWQGAYEGAAYLFSHNGSVWSQAAYIRASNAESNDEFGMAVALSGTTWAVGVPDESSAATGINGNQDDNSDPKSGAVYVFH